MSIRMNSTDQFHNLNEEIFNLRYHDDRLFFTSNLTAKSNNTCIHYEFNCTATYLTFGLE